jgi:hypothetical protein
MLTELRAKSDMPAEVSNIADESTSGIISVLTGTHKFISEAPDTNSAVLAHI